MCIIQCLYHDIQLTEGLYHSLKIEKVRKVWSKPFLGQLKLYSPLEVC